MGHWWEHCFYLNYNDLLFIQAKVISEIKPLWVEPIMHNNWNSNQGKLETTPGHHIHCLSDGS